MIDDPHGKVAHNSFLSVASELGTVGLVLFVFLIGFGAASLLKAARLFKKLGDGRMQVVAICLVVAIVGSLGVQMFQSQQQEKVIWLLLGLSSAVLAIARSEAREAGLLPNRGAGEAPGVRFPPTAPPDPLTASAGMRAPDSIRRNTGFALAMRIVGALFTGGLTLFLVRYLGPDDYGVYALAISVGGLFLLPMDFGLSRSAARFIAERRADAASVGTVLLSSIRLKAIGSGLGALALAALAGPIASAYGETDLEWPLRIVALAAFGQSFMLLFTTAFEALGINSMGFVIAFSESALEALSSLVLVLAGAGVAGAVGGRAIAYAVAAVFAAVLALRAVSAGWRSKEAPGLSLRRIATYAGALFVIDAAFAAFGYVDILLIGAILDPKSAGFFSAPAQVLTFAQYGGLALAAGVGPGLSGSAGRRPGHDVVSEGICGCSW